MGNKIEVTLERNDDTEVLLEETFEDDSLPLSWLLCRYPIADGFIKICLKSEQQTPLTTPSSEKKRREKKRKE